MPVAGQALGPRRVNVPDVATHELVLSYSASVVRGVVLDDGRRPVARAEVRSLSGGGFALTSEDGSFVLAGPPPGEWQIQARHGGRASAITSVVVDEGREADPIELVLDAKRAVIRVHVRSDGAPAPASIVFVETDAGELRLATTDAGGTAELAFQPPYPQRIRVAASARARWVFSTWIDRSEAERGVALEPGETGGLLVDSRDPEGPLAIQSADGWRVDRLLQWIGSFIHVRRDAPALIAGLPPGSYELSVAGQRVTAVVTRGETRELRFD